MILLNAELLIYAAFTTPRLDYVLNWIFTEHLRLNYKLTSDIEAWTCYEGPKIAYHREDLAINAIRIIPHKILQEDNIQSQDLFINRWKHSTILFYNQPGATVPFDIFGAVFYLLSRYEEYLPHEKDRHGRYAHTQSVAAQFSFLQQPVVDEWLMHFAAVLEKKFNLKAAPNTFQFLPTYDIDMAWKYLYKGSKRQWGGYAKDFLKANVKDITERRAVLSGKKNDPYDCFDWLDEIHSQYGLQPIYFMLLGQLSEFDKNSDPHLPAMQELMQRLSQRYDTGIHPSYKSHESPDILEEEIKILEQAGGKPVTKSRQHYIKFTLPDTYEILIDCGIQDDYSMGYASCNGFRAGTSNSFLWYNLNWEKETALRIHPFAFMEATSKFYGRQNPEEAFKEWERLCHSVKQVNGTFISIWHNYVLGTHRESKGWREFYLKTLQYLHS
jgi:hypothetical protein